MKRRDKSQTTLGELIVALTDEVGGQINDKKIAYALVAFILADMFRDPKPLALLCE